MLTFCVDSRLALGRDLLFLRQVLKYFKSKIQAGTNFDEPSRIVELSSRCIGISRKKIKNPPLDREGHGENITHLQHVAEHFTVSTALHFFIPILLNPAFTNGTIDKPAKIPGFKLPGRTEVFLLRGALFYRPAWLSAFSVFF